MSRAVLKKVTGVLTGGRDEAVPEDDPAAASEHSPPQEDQTVTPVPTDLHEPEPHEPAADPVEAAVAPDARCAEAVELARAVAVEVAGSSVGAHLAVEAEPDAGGGSVVTHSFATTDPAYVGWRWAVTVARADGADEVTVDEVVLLPGDAALLAPGWMPWSERVQPGDLGPGDLLPPAPDDPRLVPSYADVDAERLPFDLSRELGLGRPRVLSLDGRADAAERWYDGVAGPDTPVAKAAPGQCGDCGFLVPLAGALGHVFGACANAVAPDDGRVVALTHGCGAHSETVVEPPESAWSGMAKEHDEIEVLDTVVEPDEVVPAEPDGYQGAGA